MTMTYRITRKICDLSAKALNESLKLPTEPYVDGEAQIGCIHIVSQNGTNNIYQMDNKHGGCRGLAIGLSLREADDWLRAANSGVLMARKYALEVA